MPERADIVKKAASEVGYLDGQGYDGANKFSSYLGYPGEAWCADFVTAIYKICGLPLPPMQAGHRTGFSYVPAGWSWALANHATKSSWEAQPGDIVCFDWSKRCQQGTQTHTGMVDHWAGGVLNTIEGNSQTASGGSGGVNRHQWPAPVGQGNADICGLIDASKLVHFSPGGAPAPAAPAASGEHPPPFAGRTLMLKTPPVSGPEAKAWLGQMRRRGWKLDNPDAYDARADEVCQQFQKQKGLPVTGQVDAQTWAAAWTDPITNE